MRDRMEMWVNISDLNDVDLLKYIDATEAQIKLRRRGLAAAEAEAERRHLIPKKARPMGAPITERKP
jgi:hypothetical protein